jgi:hypothetical protein
MILLHSTYYLLPIKARNINSKLPGRLLSLKIKRIIHTTKIFHNYNRKPLFSFGDTLTIAQKIFLHSLKYCLMPSR